MGLEAFQQALSKIVSGDPVVWHSIWISLSCALGALVLGLLTAVPFGAYLGLYRPRARFTILALRVAMAVPTVVIGLVLFMLLSRSGLLGNMDLLYTQSAIFIGEYLLAFPLLASLTHGITRSLDPLVVETSLTLGASRWRSLWYALGESRPALVGACLATFARCLTELGVALTVGGNIKGDTRTLPASIQLELSRGDLSSALAPAMILLLLALGVTLIGAWLSGEDRS